MLVEVPVEEARQCLEKEEQRAEGGSSLDNLFHKGIGVKIDASQHEADRFQGLRTAKVLRFERV
jgi:hypothetical protein